MISIESVLPDISKWLTLKMEVSEARYLIKWLAANCEGRYVISNRDVHLLIGAPINVESPFDDELFSAPVIDKQGYLIGFENSADITKFMLYWDGSTEVPAEF